MLVEFGKPNDVHPDITHLLPETDDTVALSRAEFTIRMNPLNEVTLQLQASAAAYTAQQGEKVSMEALPRTPVQPGQLHTEMQQGVEYNRVNVQQQS